MTFVRLNNFRVSLDHKSVNSVSLEILPALYSGSSVETFGNSHEIVDNLLKKVSGRGHVAICYEVGQTDRAAHFGKNQANAPPLQQHALLSVTSWFRYSCLSEE